MYKIAISDLDGTLLGEHHNISKKTAASIANWIDSGREFVIATGRHYIEADYLQKTLEKPSYLITSNGARIHNPQGEVIFEGNLDSDIVANIAAQEFDSAVQVSIFTDQHWYVSFDVAELADLADLDVGVKFFAVVKPLQSIDPTTAIKMVFYGDRTKIEAIHAQLSKQYPDRLNLTFSLPNCLEVMQKGVHKAAAMKKVLQACHLTIEESIAFGDGMNDLEMLKAAGKGILMSNSQADLIAALPNVEQTTSNVQDGVAIVLDNLLSK
ncbi:MAG TPA: HAD family phosphatase [Psychromonas hadalis]|nr:HAD family phosphatase [Psychromonas hadalis]